MKKGIIAFLVLSMFATAISDAHPGRTNKYGCHHDRKHGGYHCHHRR